MCFLYTSQDLQPHTVQNERGIITYRQRCCCEVKRYAFNGSRPINLTWTKRDLLPQGPAVSGLPAHLQESEQHPRLARKACTFLRVSNVSLCANDPEPLNGSLRGFSSNYALRTKASLVLPAGSGFLFMLYLQTGSQLQF